MLLIKDQSSQWGQVLCGLTVIPMGGTTYDRRDRRPAVHGCECYSW